MLQKNCKSAILPCHHHFGVSFDHGRQGTSSKSNQVTWYIDISRRWYQWVQYKTRYIRWVTLDWEQCLRVMTMVLWLLLPVDAQPSLSPPSSHNLHQFTPSPIFSLIFDAPTYPVAYILPQLSSELTPSSHFSDSELTPIHPKSGCS